MEKPTLPREKNESASSQPSEALTEQKRQLRALKRLLTAKAEVRRLQSLLERHRIGAGR